MSVPQRTRLADELSPRHRVPGVPALLLVRDVQLVDVQCEDELVEAPGEVPEDVRATEADEEEVVVGPEVVLGV